MQEKYDFGLIGLGVMGKNFLLNVADQGFAALGFDLDEEKVAELMKEKGNRNLMATTHQAEFLSGLKSPRKIMLLVPAGKVVDGVIASLRSNLDAGDIIIDGGNSFFTDTDRRFEDLKADGIYFFGSGVSGGAKGARKGPSIMPGGDREAYNHIKPIFEAVAAQVNGEPCVAHLGNGSAGNYVKMVHNGIEYAMMQLISEVYDLMKQQMCMSNEAMQSVFEDWNKGKLASFLVEITAEILGQPDDLSTGHLVDQILDKAKQKGTGKWTSQNAMDLGIPIPTIDVSVSMREISAMKAMRKEAESLYGMATFNNESLSLSELGDALYFSFIMAYAQGMHQLKEASQTYDYALDMEIIAKIWRGGCIIRSAFLEDMRKAYQGNSELSHLLLDPAISDTVKQCYPALTKIVSVGITSGIPVSALSASLNYFNSFRSERLPLNLIQAQRDHFGAHTYERIDQEGIFHTDWGTDK